MSARVTIVEDLGGLELIEASFQQPRFTRHAHATYALGTVVSGVNHFRYRGAAHDAPAGSLCTVTPDEAHDVEPKWPPGFAYRCLYPSRELVQAIAESVQLRPLRNTILLPPVVHDALAASLVHTVFDSVWSGASSLERDTALARLVARALTRHAAQPLRPRPARPTVRVALAHDYLASHYSDNVTLAQLAALTNVDPFVLLRCFTRAYGLPPHAWLVQERVRRAQAMLRAGLPPVEVASQVGFTDQSHLTRCFKRIVGVTPGCYQRGTIGRDCSTVSDRYRDAERKGGRNCRRASP